MSRAPRIFMENACYHIITRGNQKQIVFRNDKDYVKFLTIVKKARRKYDVRLYAYCLMPNHVHLLIEPINARNISKFMHYVTRGYVAYYNHKYEKVGHLWQGRFIGKPIVKDQYLVHCANYIESNPLRSNIAANITEYPWSSYNERCLHQYGSNLDDLSLARQGAFGDRWGIGKGTVGRLKKGQVEV